MCQNSIYDTNAEESFSIGGFVDEKSEQFLCRLDDGIRNMHGITMIMLHADELLRRISAVINLIVASCIHIFWIFLHMY
jgi:hypothetical protein